MTHGTHPPMHLFAVFATCSLLGCSASSGTATGEESGGTSSGGTASGGAGGSDVIFGGGGSDPVGPSTVGECGGDAYRGEAGRLDVYVMMDRSGSMLIPFIIDLWTPIGTAIGDFVVRPEAAGIGIGIGFFENQAGSCEATDYAVPVAPIALLPGNAEAIRTAIVNNTPTLGGTPTRPALEGAILHARDHASQTGTKTIVVLATDGHPEECDSTVDNVAAAAAAGLAGSPSIPTYVIGIGDVAALNQVAASGGTNQAFIVPADPAVASQQFLDAMNAIRGAALPCDYAIPSEADDPNLVNVQFTPEGGASEIVPNVGDASGCQDSGWYYDDPNAPGRIIACPGSCNAFNASGAATVNVVVGCPTVTIR